jgi:AraC-like DNA-binding protein
VVKTVDSYQISIAFGDVDADLFLLPGFFVHASACSGPLHAHQHTECHIVHSGTMEIHTEQNNYRLVPGDICFIPKFLDHCICDATQDIQKCSFNLRLVQRKAKEPQLFSEFSKLFDMEQVTILHHTTIYERHYQTISDSIATGSPADLVRLQASSTLLLLDLADLLKTHHTSESPVAVPEETAAQHESEEYLFKLELYIQRHYAEDISLNTAAEHLHLSPRQVGRLLKSHSGRSFGETLLHQRMLSARELLKDPSIPISKIRALVGYRSYPGFYSSFRKFWNMTPNQFRQTFLK